MKILGRIKKSKVLTAVMTAVLIFQSACPTGLAYAAQKSGVSAYAAGQTIDQALGATKTVESVLSQHENDEYYLTTPYGNKGPHGEGGAIDTWDCWKPKGEYGSGAYMNCTGFVVAVLRACGANTSIIGNYTAKDGYNRGNETNASKWDEYCRDNNAVSYTFSSKEQIQQDGAVPSDDGDGQNLIRVATVRMKTGGLGVKANAVHIYHLIHVTVDRRITVFLVVEEPVVIVLCKLECTLFAAPVQGADICDCGIVRHHAFLILSHAVPDSPCRFIVPIGFPRHPHVVRPALRVRTAVHVQTVA